MFSEDVCVSKFYFFFLLQVSGLWALELLFPFFLRNRFIMICLRTAGREVEDSSIDIDFLIKVEAVFFQSVIGYF